MIKKKLSVFLIILFLLTGCGNSFKPEEVTYEGTYRNNDDFGYFLYMHCIPVESMNKVDCSNSDLDSLLKKATAKTLSVKMTISAIQI